MLISPANWSVDEDPEAVAGAELPLAVADAAARRERLAAVDGIGAAGKGQRLPPHQPVAAATAAPPPTATSRRPRMRPQQSRAGL